MPIIRKADVLLGTLEQGQLIQDLQTMFDDVLAQLTEQGEHVKVKGDVTVKLSITVEKGQAEIRADLKANVPRPPRPKTFFFATPGGLSTDHPRQLDMWNGPREVADA